MGEQSNVASRRAPVSESLREPANPRWRLLKTVRRSTQIADWVFRASVAGLRVRNPCDRDL